MNASPQITSVEPRIRMPACRSASPKNMNTRAAEHERDDAPGEACAISPKEAIAVRPLSAVQPRHLMTEISGWVASSVCVKT